MDAQRGGDVFGFAIPQCALGCDVAPDGCAGRVLFGCEFHAGQRVSRAALRQGIFTRRNVFSQIVTFFVAPAVRRDHASAMANETKKYDATNRTVYAYLALREIRDWARGEADTARLHAWEAGQRGRDDVSLAHDRRAEHFFHVQEFVEARMSEELEE